MSSNEPLWRLLYDAYDNSTDSDGGMQNWSERNGYAAEIRAVADEIEAHPMADRCIEWGEVADWLRTEADRAEQSNG